MLPSLLQNIFIKKIATFVIQKTHNLYGPISNMPQDIDELFV